MQILISSSDAKCRVNHRIIVWHGSPKWQLDLSVECQTAQREAKSIAFTKDCQLLYADAEEPNTEVNFKLNLKHTHGPLGRPDCRNTTENKDMPAISLYITLLATKSTEWCFAMCFNSSMCFSCIPVPFILDTNNGGKRRKPPCLCWLFIGQKKWQELSIRYCHSKDKVFALGRCSCCLQYSLYCCL